MKRAVITGLGIVSCLGNDKASVAHSLREGISGIRRREDFAEMGLRCNVGQHPCWHWDARKHC